MFRFSFRERKLEEQIFIFEKRKNGKNSREEKLIWCDGHEKIDFKKKRNNIFYGLKPHSNLNKAFFYSTPKTFLSSTPKTFLEIRKAISEYHHN